MRENLRKLGMGERGEVGKDINGAASPGASHFGFSEAMRLAVWCGVAAGLGEGLLDLTAAHYHARAMLSLSALVYPFLFIAVGADTGILARGSDALAGKFK